MNTHVRKASRDLDFNDAWDYIGSRAHDGKGFGKRVWSAIGRAKDWLVAKLRPISYEEAFLAQAQNHADLERRMLILQDPQSRHSYWR